MVIWRWDRLEKPRAEPVTPHLQDNWVQYLAMEASGFRMTFAVDWIQNSKS